NIAFKVSSVPLDNLNIFDLVVRRFRNGGKIHRVIAAAHPSHLDVQNLGVEKLRNLARPDEKRRVLIEEARPMARVALVLRRLIGDQCVSADLLGATQEIVDELVAGNEPASEAAPRLAQKRVECSHTLRLVND